MEWQVESRYDFDATIAAIVAEAPVHKYTVLKVHEQSKILASKGFPREPVTIIEVCNAKASSIALNHDIRSGLMMPCPIMVYQKSEKVFVMTYDTRIMSSFYEGGKPMAETGEAVYKDLQKIIKSIRK